MLARQLCHKFLSSSLKEIHQKRVRTIEALTLSLLNDSHLTLSSIGQNLSGAAKVKNKIKRVDRFLGNERVHEDILYIYKGLASWIFEGMEELFIFVDWSGCCRQEQHIVRASAMYQGRSINIYNETYSRQDMETEQTHGTFLENLKEVLPRKIKVTIITDAGFKTPWFKKVQSLGWNFAGRVRGNIQFRLENETDWQSTKALHSKAINAKVVRLGKGQLGKTTSKSLEGHFFIYKAFSKGRKKKKQKGKSIFPDNEKRCKALNTEPWILFSSCENSIESAQHVKKIYKGRMQIEQNFRDDKSERFGMGFRYSRTKSLQRLNTLFLLSTIATYLLWWIGVSAEKKKLHWDFQANTVRSRRVLSFIFLAKKIIKQDILTLDVSDCFSTLNEVRRNYRSIVLC